METELHTFLISTLDDCEWLPSRYSHFTADDGAPGIQSRPGRGGKQKNPYPWRKSNPGRPTCTQPLY